MVIPPGWNVTEPLQLAWQLCRVAQSLKSASDDARTFAIKIQTFSSHLELLQEKLVAAGADSAKLFEKLRSTLSNCQECVKRCEEFNQQFRELNGPNTSRSLVAGPVRWVWKAKEADKLSHLIDSRMNDITVILAIENL